MNKHVDSMYFFFHEIIVIKMISWICDPYIYIRADFSKLCGMCVVVDMTATCGA